jgi:hypothetical protein
VSESSGSDASVFEMEMSPKVEKPLEGKGDDSRRKMIGLVVALFLTASVALASFGPYSVI